MTNEKVFVSYGNLIADYIYSEDDQGNFILLKKDGGGCEWNDLYNLAKMGEKCYAIASRGNDDAGEIAQKSLEEAGVITQYIHLDKSQNTNIMNIIIPEGNCINDNSVIHSWYSPLTNECTMNFNNNLSTSIPDELKEKHIYLILDKFYVKHLEFIRKIKGNKTICLDVGHARFIEHFSKKYLLEFFSQASFMQLNNNVLNLILNRFKIKNVQELYELLKLDLLVITKGKNGAQYVFKEDNKIKILSLEPETISNSVDTSGAGDAFFSKTLKDYAYLTTPITEEFLRKSFFSANEEARNILNHIGSRK